MIKVLMVLENTGRGGSQAYVMNVIRNLDKNKYHIGVVISRCVDGGFQDEMKQLGCTLYILPRFKVYNIFSYIKAWKKFLENNSYDIVHAHCTNSAGIYLRVAKAFGCKTIAHSHSAGYRGKPYEKITKAIFAKLTKSAADLWFSCSDLAAIRLYGKHYRESAKFHSMPNAICVSNYKFDVNKRNAIRDKYNISDDVKLYGHVGTISVPKNHKFLLKIFSEILKANPTAKLLLCGNGRLANEVRQQVSDLGIEKSVIFAGVVSNVADYFMAMDVMIFPSLFEGLPISVVEAQATGLPILHSDVITTEVDITALANKLSLDDSEVKWAELASCLYNADRLSCFSIVEESVFNMETSIKQLEKQYDNLVISK